MEKISEKISVVVMSVVYLLCSLRYSPGQPAATIVDTAIQLLTVAPFLIGAVLIFSSFYKKAGEVIGWHRAARIYLALGIIIEFFLGLRNYYKINLVG